MSVFPLIKLLKGRMRSIRSVTLNDNFYTSDTVFETSDISIVEECNYFITCFLSKFVQLYKVKTDHYLDGRSQYAYFNDTDSDRHIFYYVRLCMCFVTLIQYI